MQGKIPCEDFDQIQSQLNEEEKDLIKLFYELDSNYTEKPMYLLKNEKNEKDNSTIKVSIFIIFKKFFIIKHYFKNKINSNSKKELLGVISKVVQTLFEEKRFDSQKRAYF